ncbi:MAG TPA: ribonuclease HII [bacterium]|nr:ribonuclease HII [bacterium]
MAPRLQAIEAEALQKPSLQEALDFVRLQLGPEDSAGAKRLLEKFERKAAKEEKEKDRLKTLLRYETEARQKGWVRVAGVDEAGRGPLAGPVVAAAVILDPDLPLAGVNDSKKLTPEKRESLFPIIQDKSLAYGIGMASVEEIDSLNIYKAARLAMERAVEAIAPPPDMLLTDAMPLPKFQVPQKPLVHGDALSLSIAAASILAKVTRDRMMAELHDRYPHYGFGNHMGYGTAEHLQALEEHGPCPEHRLTFGPVLNSLARKFPDGPLGFWRHQLENAQDADQLQQVGVRIKRLTGGQFTEVQMEGLREVFRSRRAQWP